MIQKTFLVIAAAGLFLACGWQTPARADNDALRSYELRLFNICRGYLRPMTATSERLRKLGEFSRLEPVGHSDGVTTFKLSTVLTPEKVASTLGMTLLSSNEGKLLLGVGDAKEAAQAEARTTILAIATAVQKKFGATADEERGGPEKRPKDLAELLKLVDLPETILEGKAYKPSDYHLNMAGGSTYVIWAGSSYQGLQMANQRNWESELVDTVDPDPSARFVGVRLSLERYNKGMVWIDLDGSDLNDYGFERDARTNKNGDATGELAVVLGGRCLKKVLVGMATYRQKKENAKLPVSELKSGRKSDYELSQALNLKRDDYALWQWFPDDSITISWSEDPATHHAIARVRSHFVRHPMHLDGTLDADEPLPEFAADDPDFAGLAVNWKVAPETGPQDFQQRPKEAEAAMGLIRDALFAAAKAGGKMLTGSLADKAFCDAIKLDSAKLNGKYFKAADYSVSRQLLNDVAISVGSPTTGGCRWMLIDLTAQETIRSGQ